MNTSSTTHNPSLKGHLAAGTVIAILGYINYALNSWLCCWLWTIPYIGWLLAILNAVLSLAAFAYSAPKLYGNVADFVNSGEADAKLNAAISKVRSIFKR